MDQAGIIRDLLASARRPSGSALVFRQCGGKSRLFQVAFAKDVQRRNGPCHRCVYPRTSFVEVRCCAASYRPPNPSDIALQYRFDSQQTFYPRIQETVCRYAGALPPFARLECFWHPPANAPRGEFILPKHEFVTLPPMHLIGTTQSYTCSLEEISDFRNQMRIQFWRDFFK